jgi:hypothetical protein
MMSSIQGQSQCCIGFITTAAVRVVDRAGCHFSIFQVLSVTGYLESCLQVHAHANLHELQKRCFVWHKLRFAVQANDSTVLLEPVVYGQSGPFAINLWFKVNSVYGDAFQYLYSHTTSNSEGSGWGPNQV